MTPKQPSYVLQNVNNFYCLILEFNLYCRSDAIFIIGVACYRLFIQANWTGPSLSKL